MAIVELKWRKSSFSAQGDQCVEVAALPSGALVRDSKNPGPILRYPLEEWMAFLVGVKDGRFQ